MFIEPVLHASGGARWHVGEQSVRTGKQGRIDAEVMFASQGVDIACDFDAGWTAADDGQADWRRIVPALQQFLAEFIQALNRLDAKEAWMPIRTEQGIHFTSDID
jgi:hypothetical protein